MKKIIKLLPLIAVIFAMTGLASCKSNESKKDSTESNIVGKWTLVEYTDPGDQMHSVEPGYNTLEFKEDGTVTKYEHFGTDYDGTHKWTKNGNTLTIGEWPSMTITKLTAEELEVTSSDEYGTTYAKYKKM